MSTAVNTRVRGLLLAVLVMALQPAPAAGAAPAAVSVPIYLEFPLLRHLLVRQLFATPDGKREILNDPKECNRILLSEPSIGAHGEDLEILARVEAQLGVDIFGSCLDLFNWQGGVAFLGRPRIQPDAKSIKLTPQNTWLIASDGSKVLSGRLWDAGKASLVSFFGSFVLDLTPQLAALGALLPDVLPNRSADKLRQTIDSLCLSNIQVNPESLNLSVNFEIEALAEQAPAATELSAEELQQFEAQWHMMDALLVGAVKRYAAATELQDLRSKLLDILIDSRYRLRDVLTQPPGRNSDAVRSWFIDSWHSLSPVVRTIAEQQEGQENLLWFSAVTAADALYALNQVGSVIGLEISTDGLRRLARMISEGQADDLLRYSEDVDPELQRLLREDIEHSEPDVSAFWINFSVFPRAYAEAPGESLNQWLPVKGKLKSYLPKVASLLEQATKRTLELRELEHSHREVYAKLVLATAWQESCWRQYVVVDKRIEPLRSASGDIGLMQVNERVWRGFYDLQKLRWDINYNSRAGSEILLDYMVKYALKRGEQKQPGGIANLARASYSAYNGGPGQVARYRGVKVAAAHRKIDSLFWEKYRQVDAGKAMNVARCLGEELELSST
jgi:hypothetical protein